MDYLTIAQYFDDPIQQRRSRYDIHDLIIYSLLAAHDIQPRKTPTEQLTHSLAQVLNHQLLIIAKLGQHPAEIELPANWIVGKKGRITLFNTIIDQLQYHMDNRSPLPTQEQIDTICAYARQIVEIVAIIPTRIDKMYAPVELDAIFEQAEMLLEYM